MPRGHDERSWQSMFFGPAAQFPQFFCAADNHVHLVTIRDVLDQLKIQCFQINFFLTIMIRVQKQEKPFHHCNAMRTLFEMRIFKTEIKTTQ